MKTDELARRIKNACAEVKAAEEELTEIDSRFGDADHGLTMRKICNAIEGAVDNNSGGSIKALIAAAAEAVMGINGGSAVPLWNSWLDGMQEAAPETDEVDAAGIKAMFASAFEMLDFMSGAKTGDKTMMDAVIPASEAIAAYAGDDESEIFTLAADAAEKGAEETKNYVAKYGRAKSYGTKTIGTPDAGAVSMARFFKGLAEF